MIPSQHELSSPSLSSDITRLFRSPACHERTKIGFAIITGLQSVDCMAIKVGRRPVGVHFVDVFMFRRREAVSGVAGTISLN